MEDASQVLPQVGVSWNEAEKGILALLLMPLRTYSHRMFYSQLNFLFFFY